MDMPQQAFSDSEDELEMDFNPSLDSLSDSNSSCTLDSGVSSGTRTTSDNSWYPLEIDNQWSDSSDSLFSFEAQNVLISQAIYFLQSSDSECSLNASAYLFHLCRGGCSPMLFQACPYMLDAMLSVVRSPSTYVVESFHFLSGILYYLSHTEEGVDLILSSNGVEILSYFLISPLESVLYYTVAALHSLLLARRSARDVVRDSCIVNRLILLLNLSVSYSGITEQHKNGGLCPYVNPKFLAVLCDSLHILAYGHEATKRVFIEQGAIRSLVQLISRSYYEKLLWTGTRLLRVLSAWLPAKLEVLANDNFLQFFSHCISFGSFRVTASALWTLRNLSDLVLDKLTVDVILSVVERLISQLQQSFKPIEQTLPHQSVIDSKDHIVLCRCIMDIVGNLTCGNCTIKCHLVKLNGINLIARMLCWTLRNVTYRPPTTSPVSTIFDTHTHSALCQSLSNLTLCSSEPPEVSPRHAHNSRTLKDEHSSCPSVIPTQCPSSLTSSALASLSIDCSPNRSPSPGHSFRSSKPSTYVASTRSTLNPSAISVTPSLSSHTYIPWSCLSASIDLLESGFRCLAHLTAGHSDVLGAVSSILHQRMSSHMLVSGAPSQLFIPLLEYCGLTESCARSKLAHPSTTSNEPIIQTLQLIRAWTTFVNNLWTILCSGEPTQIKFSKTTYRHFSRSGLLHLRHSLRRLNQQLTTIAEAMPDKPADMTAVQQLVHHLMGRLLCTTNVSQEEKS
ncbi:Junction plakoglobin [Paragonimus westermani]|uniref:Junction plakoglobin n=1 Tax=Paragonimus westermani TaxID=34504 RepID=A0A8T0DE10_9TREM|nr:Junction plakoglobin [Paragonimus westermani]